MGDAVDERSGLPRSRAGDDEEWSVAMGGRCRLLGVERRGEVPRGWVDSALSSGIDAREIRHAAQYRFGERSG
jgi:hypothetical protein